MEVPEDVSVNSLELCSYRSLQQLAKSMSLPSNVKKVCLIEMIYATKHQTPEQVAVIVARIKEKRKQTAKPRKARQKKRVQGTEISSTSNHSPPICATPTPDYQASRTVRKFKSLLNPLTSKRAVESDRVLRSYNNRVRRTKYSIINMNNYSVIKAQDSVSQKERQYGWNMGVQEYRPVRVGDSLLQRLMPRESDYMLPQLSQNQVDVNRKWDDVGNRNAQLVPANGANAVAVRERRLSGIYPLDQKQTYHQYLTTVGVHRKDGRISKINAIIQKPISKPEMIKNKMTQTTAQKRLVQKPVVVSVRNAHLPKLTTVQDVVDYKVDGNFSNSSTESATESLDREIMPRIITSKSFQEGFENTTFSDKNSLMRNRNCSIQNAKREAERRRLEVSKSSSDQMYIVGNKRRNDQKTCATENQTMRIDNKIYAINNQARLIHNNMYAIHNHRLIKKKNCATENNTQYQALGVHDAENATEPNTRDYQTYIDYFDRQSERRTYSNKYINKENPNKTSNGECVIVVSKEQVKNGNATSNLNNAGESINFSEVQASSNAVDINQNSILNVDKNKTDYPNMSALTDVFPENLTQVVSGILTVPQSVSTGYYKNIGAELVRPLSYSGEDALPHINDVFSQFPKPLYEPSTAACECVDVHQPTSKEHSINKGCLESIYNYQAPELDQPLDFHHKIATTTTTKCVFSTQTTTTAVTRSDPTGQLNSQLNNTEQPDSRPCSRSETIARIHDYLKSAEQECVSYREAALLSESQPDSQLDSQPDSQLDSQPDSQPDSQLYSQPDSQPDSQLYSSELELTSPLHDYFNLAEDVGSTFDECSQEIALSPSLSGSPAPTLLLGGESVRTAADYIDDALELISQDGDYMERIGMDVRMQCILCDWAGPKSLLTYHIGFEHSSEVISRSSPKWSSLVPLARGARGRGARGACELSACGGRLYVLSAGCVGGDSFRADITVLPKDDDTEYIPKYGRLTVYNNLTGEPRIWEGLVPDLPEGKDEDETNGLCLNLSSLDLIPNRALKLANGEWVNSTDNVSDHLDDIEIVVHVQLYD